MNLYLLRKKNISNLKLNKSLLLKKSRVKGERYYSYKFESIAFRFLPVKLFKFIDWHKTYEYHQCVDLGFKVKNLSLKTFVIEVSYCNKKNKVLSKVHLPIAPQQEESIPLPEIVDKGEVIDLVVRILPESFLQKIKFELTVSRVVEHTRSIQKLCGNGVEIGPGHNPRVNTEGVKYLEKYDPKDWVVANKITESKSLDFSNYLIGEAHQIPVPDNSLDFVFSSHVFEHLYNPLGHLDHWFKKLKPGGQVLCVVPGICGAKDYFARPSKLDDLVKQYERDDFEIPVEVYDYYSKIREWSISGEELKKEERSIHVSFFDENAIQKVLDYAVNNLGYSSYKVDYARNHKDFNFMLVK